MNDQRLIELEQCKSMRLVGKTERPKDRKKYISPQRRGDAEEIAASPRHCGEKKLTKHNSNNQ